MVKVSIIMGSKNDEPLMQPAMDVLKELSIEFETIVMSAHRNPDKVRTYALEAVSKGIEVIIAGAGAAAHLPGIIASWTEIPVIGVPLPATELKGVDSLYSIVQMPGGVPVACMAIGSAGAKNAAVFTAQILALKYTAVKEALLEYRKRISK